MFVLAFVFVFVFVLIVACVFTHLFLFVHGRLRAGVARERMGKGGQGQQAGVWWCEGREGGEGQWQRRKARVSLMCSWHRNCGCELLSQPQTAVVNCCHNRKLQLPLFFAVALCFAA